MPTFLGAHVVPFGTDRLDYLRVLTEEMLPAFKGRDVHQRVLDSGARISGCSVHFVVPEVDSGPVIAQAAVPTLPSDTADVLAARILRAEHKLYPFALRLLAEGRVVLDGEKVIYWEVKPAVGELFSPGQ